MKYLREVTPYFRKSSSSILGEILWVANNDNSEDFLSKTTERSIPLHMCYVSHGPSSDISGVGNSALVVEIRSADAKSLILLRCADETSAEQWTSSICTVVTSLVQRSIAKVNSQLIGGRGLTNGSISPNNNTSNELNVLSEIKHMGWLCEQVSL